MNNIKHNSTSSLLLKIPGEIRNEIYISIFEGAEFRVCPEHRTGKGFLQIGKRDEKSGELSFNNSPSYEYVDK
jgi:hypothetical protein